MMGVVDQEGSQLVVGVDTHQDEHVAVAIDRQGVRLGELHTWRPPMGMRSSNWSRGLGEIHAFGIEGTGSYGRSRPFLTSRGHTQPARPVNPLSEGEERFH